MTSMPTPARILLIDDHQLMRDALRIFLRGQADLELADNACDTETGWQLVQELKPDLVLMDLDVPTKGGVTLTTSIRQHYPEMKVVVLTAYADVRHVQAALAAGANGYVAKLNSFHVVLDAMRVVLTGKTYLCPETSAVLVQQMQQRPGGSLLSQGVLSAREIEVLKQIADGYSTKEIAFNLQVSTKTIESHRQNVMAKLKIDSVAELTKFAVREGLTTL